MNINVLVVEDDIFSKKLIKTYLKKYKEFKEIHEASNGIEAIELLNNEDIDLILLDIFMPKMNGYELLSHLKTESTKFGDIPVIMMTTDDSAKTKALNTGANSIIIKPSSEEEIVKEIKTYFRCISDKRKN